MFQVTQNLLYNNIFFNLRKICRELTSSCHQGFVSESENIINEESTTLILHDCETQN